MACNIAFYVHHHGSGHLMRSLSIAAHLQDCKVTFLGSDLGRYQSIIPGHICCIVLPLDTSTKDDYWAVDRDAAGLHYAPLGVSGQKARVAMLSKFFAEHDQLLLVVDVSVEVAMLATLCGIPTVIVRQHGKRDDLPHTLAYKNAMGLLAPYGRSLQPKEAEWLSQKTFFTGGFSRYAAQTDNTTHDCRQVAILVGRGGTSIDKTFISKILGECPNWHFNLIGDIEGVDMNFSASNLSVYKHLADPLAILSQCIVVIGNAGHNTVMEVASLNKRMIVIPENRPFEEQLVKAQMLEKLSLARMVLPESILSTDWSAELGQIVRTTPNWRNTIIDTAAFEAANYIKAIFFNQFSYAII
jgi:UDP-N-acetylglucosamine:LPS N-acetylglucosamine transferase